MAVFSLERDEPFEKPEAIKWTIGKEKYELYLPTLCEMDIASVTQHCLSVMHKIDAVIGADADHRAASYSKVLPRTFSVSLCATWDINAVDHPVARNDLLVSTNNQIAAFFALHAHDDDRHDLLKYIENVRKPRTMPVQTYFARLRELNTVVPWLPGTDAKMTDSQLNHAFLTGMPLAWQERYSNAGRSARLDTRVKLLKFFLQQQASANKAQKANESTQKLKSATNGSTNRASRRDKAVARFSDKDKRSKRGLKHKNGKHCVNKSSQVFPSKGRVADTDQCPVHPDHDHTWGSCFLHARNPDRNKPKGKNGTKGKKPAAKSNKDDADDGHAMDAVSMASTVSTIETPHRHKAVNKSSSSDDEVEINMAQITLDDPVPKKAKKGMSNMSCSPTTLIHHFDVLSFDSFLAQELNVYTYDEMADLYVSHCLDSYSSGELNEHSSNFQSFDSVLCLRATSHAIVHTMQHTRVNRLMRVLFDTGADKTMIKRSAIPKGINPSSGRKRKVTGVTSSVIMDKEIVIENMILPEFSPTKRVSGPITCIVMDNESSQYDLILGMDLMQLLGIDIHTSTKTVIWDGLRVPFKPRDYFTSELFTESLHDAMLGSHDDVDDDLGYKAITIKSSLYEKHNTDEVAQQQVHLTPQQRDELAKVLAKFPKLFSGKLGCYTHKKVHLELKSDAVPFRCRPYPVPKHHQSVFKEELDCL